MSKSRIRNILNYRKPAFWLILCGVVAVGAAILFFLTDPIPAAPELPELTPLASNPTAAPVLTVEADSTASPAPVPTASGVVLPVASPRTPLEGEPIAEPLPRREAKDFAPADFHDLVRVEMHEAFGDFVVEDTESLRRLEALLSRGKADDDAGCPFGYALYLTRADGVTGVIYPAMDSCGVFHSGAHSYRYADDNEAFWPLTGIQPDFAQKEYENGRLIRSVTYNWYRPVWSLEYRYDENSGLLAEAFTVSYSNTGERETGVRDRYRYDAQGHFVQSSLPYLKAVTETLPDGTVTETLEIGSELIQTISFDSSGEKTGQSLLERVPGTEDRFSRESLFDAQGRFTGYEIYTYEGQSLRVQSFDAEGNPQEN